MDAGSRLGSVNGVNDIKTHKFFCDSMHEIGDQFKMRDKFATIDQILSSYPFSDSNVWTQSLFLNEDINLDKETNGMTPRVTTRNFPRTYHTSRGSISYAFSSHWKASLGTTNNKQQTEYEKRHQDVPKSNDAIPEKKQLFKESIDQPVSSETQSTGNSRSSELLDEFNSTQEFSVDESDSEL